MQFGLVPNGDGKLADMFMCQDIGQRQNTGMDIGFLVIGEETEEGIFGYLENGNKFQINRLQKTQLFRKYTHFLIYYRVYLFISIWFILIPYITE